MKTSRQFKTFWFIAFIAITIQSSNAQLEFCSGNSGDPIFTEDFGTGTTPGPALPSGTTVFNFTAGAPFDGDYTISNTSDFYGWHTGVDHTPNDVNGKYFIINADFNAGEFYQRTVTGLCENTSYEFSSWLINLLPPSPYCPGGGIPINVRFQIWDSSNNNLLAFGDTGNITGTHSPDWKQYGLVFKTDPGQTSVILKMLNNGDGGCGNDLAIDDIVFKSCGDFISLTNTTGENSIAQCESEGVIVSTTITATPDASIYNSHVFQWQESSDAINWIDIAGETANTYTTPTLIDSRHFRVKVAEDVLNISNPLCNVVSEVFNAIIVAIADPPISNGDVAVCANSLSPLTVSTPNNQVVNWYDAPTGGNLIFEHSSSFTPNTSGTYYAAASSNLIDCFSPSRTALTYTIYDLPVVADENSTLCENAPITLEAGISNLSYFWSTGETTVNIEVVTPGIYTVDVSNSYGCTVTKTINVTQIDEPIFDTIRSNNEDIIVTTTEDGDYEYALNNGSFQDSPVFEMIPSGLHQLHVRGVNDCPVVSQEYLHFVIPKFFSPNGDSVNDNFVLEGLAYYSNIEVQIYDRYGLLIKQSKDTSFSWNGTFNGKALPSADYWYHIKVDRLQFKGHFTLKR